MLRNDLIHALTAQRENDVFVRARVRVYTKGGGPEDYTEKFVWVKPTGVYYDPSYDSIVIQATEDYD